MNLKFNFKFAQNDHRQEPSRRTASPAKQIPYPCVDRDLAPDVFYPNYIETYLERDVRNLINVKDLRQFRLFLKLCAGNAGQRLNVQALARDCGISGPTAKAWLSVLESSFITFTLSPFYRNFNKRVIKSPKLYFYDTGLICNLLEIREPEDAYKSFAMTASCHFFV